MSDNVSAISTPYTQAFSNRSDEIVKILSKTFNTQTAVILTFETQTTPAKIIAKYGGGNSTENISHAAVQKFCDQMKLARSAQLMTKHHPTKYDCTLLTIAGAPIFHPEGHICGAICIFNGSSNETEENTRFILEKFSTILSSYLLEPSKTSSSEITH